MTSPRTLRIALAVFGAISVLAAPRATAAESFPYKIEPAFGNVAFRQPVQVVFAPGETQRAFVVELEGCIAVVRDVAHPKREVFLDLTKRIGPQRDGHGPLSMAFHPKFAENGLFYVWFSVSTNSARANRLARFKLSATNPDVADPASETPLITQPTGRTGHDGCTLLFGADGYLYVSIGDGDMHAPGYAINHQHVDQSFFGVILRLDVDQKPGSLAPNPHPSVHAGSYAVPPDNPFVGAKSFNGANVDPAKVRTEFWAVGLRNPWRLAFDPATGRLWCGDVGLHEREEIDLITRGGNYGWDYREGVIAGPRSRPPAAAHFIEPVWDYGHPEGISITGGFVYHGKACPDLEGKYLFADYGFGQVWALEPDGEKTVDRSHIRQIAKDIGGLVALTSDPGTSDVLLTNIANGHIERLVRNPAAK